MSSSLETAEPQDSAESGTPRVSVEVAVDAGLRVLAEVVSGHPHAEDRPQQREMTELVSQAAITGDPLIVQAGTGTGKSLAYLCAAIGAQTPAVVSTATRQLSDQLANNDIPLMAEAAKKVLGRPLQARSLKGRSNYLCLAKLDDLQRLEASSPSDLPPLVEEQAFDLGIEVPEPEPEPEESEGDTLEERSTLNRPSAADLEALKDLLEWSEDPGDGDRAGHVL